MENKVARSLHLHHVPQADMLECRLEILLIAPHLNNLHDVWLVEFWVNLHKANFILHFRNQNFFNHLKTFKGQDNPQLITTTQILG
jgi:hypothetical protein